MNPSNLKQEKPVLSVIVPAYNQEKYIKKCIDSIKECGFLCEIVVIDDGSTDNTTTILKDINGIINYRQSNKGLPAARNKGFEISNGKYVIFLDADDELLSCDWSQAINIIENNPAINLVYGNVLLGASLVSATSTNFIKKLIKIRHLELDPKILIFNAEDFREFVLEGTLFLGAVLFRREKIEKVGLFNISQTGSEDWAFSTKFIFEAGGQVAFRNTPHCFYRQVLNSMSRNQEKMSKGYYMTLEEIMRKYSSEMSTPSKRRISHLIKHHRFSYGYEAYARSHYLMAKYRFQEGLLKNGFYWKSFCYYLVTLFPIKFIDSVRKLVVLASIVDPKNWTSK